MAPLTSIIGVSKALQQLGIIKPGNVKTAGSSIGALAMVRRPPAHVCVHACGRKHLHTQIHKLCRAQINSDLPALYPCGKQGVNYPMGSCDEFVAKGLSFTTKCRSQRNCFGTLDAEYAKLLDAVLVPNVHEISAYAWLAQALPCPAVCRSTTWLVPACNLSLHASRAIECKLRIGHTTVHMDLILVLGLCRCVAVNKKAWMVFSRNTTSNPFGEYVNEYPSRKEVNGGGGYWFK